MAARLFAFILACTFLLSAGSISFAGEIALFGSPEEKSSDISTFYKWTNVLSRFSAQPNPDLWQRDDAMLRALPLKKMAAKVNSIINDYAYISDTHKMESQIWRTPQDFFTRGGGSCQDFAIAKYLWLEHLGVPQNALRIAIVYDKKRELPHAVALVYTDGAILVLDNQNKYVKDSRLITGYTPIYSINRQAWWRYTGQGVLVDESGEVSVQGTIAPRDTLATSGH